MNHKTKGVLLIAVLCLLVLAAAAGGIHKVRSVEGFLEGTTLDGEDISGQPVKDVTSRVTGKMSGAKVVLTEDGTTVLEGSLADFGHDFDEQKFSEDLLTEENRQKHSLRTTFQRLVENTGFQLTDYYENDNDKLEKFVVSQNFLVPRIKAADARVQLNEEKGLYEVVAEVEGNEIDDARLQEYVEKVLGEAIENDSFLENPVLTISIPQDVYLSIDVAPETEALRKEALEKNRQLVADTFANISITYTFGSQTEVLEGSEIVKWITISDDLDFEINEDKVAEFVSELADKYETRWRDRVFIANDGRIVHFTPDVNQYGYTINEDAEIWELTSDIQSRESVTREPIYFQADSNNCPVFYSREGMDDLNGTYVAVSISRQHLWFYKEGTLIVESDVVTGNDGSSETETMVGCYPLAYKNSPATLQGETSEDFWYSDVDYWMAFNQGQGLHDAPWRSEFGGDIYKEDGSHGCVNLPSDVAATIYENIDPGMAIIVYR